MRTFYSAQDIEDMAAQGTTQLLIDDNTVLTDLARETARRLGIALVHRSAGTPSTAVGVPDRMSQATTLATSPAKPAGCQHGPLPASQPRSPSSPQAETQPSTATSNTGTVVDQAVNLVKQLASKR